MKKNDGFNLTQVDKVEAKLTELGYNSEDIKKTLEDIKMNQFKINEGVKTLKVSCFCIIGAIATSLAALLFIKK